MIIKAALASLIGIAAALGLVTLPAQHGPAFMSGDVQVYCASGSLCPNGLAIGS